MKCKNNGGNIPYGYYVERVCGAMERSAREKRWVAIEEVK